MKVLVTGGTVFVSKYTAEYFAQNGKEVYVLNRNSHPQVKGVHLIEADRHKLGNKLKNMRFDLIIDVTSYCEQDILDFVPSLGDFGKYVMISSSAVYPETGKQPFEEESCLAENKFWGKYGTDKIAAERKLSELVPNAYILRPPYLYGEYNNVYREAFVFDCALSGRKFYLPEDGSMKLQFLHVKDLCRFIEHIIEQEPKEHIYNVGNEKAVSIKEWAELCYKCAGVKPEFAEVTDGTEQRNYFSFYNYEYYLDVKKMKSIMAEETDLYEGLMASFEWYKNNTDEVRKKPFVEYIDNNLGETK